MNLGYLYNQTISLPYYTDLNEHFDATLVDIAVDEIPLADGYIIDLSHITKELSLKIKNFFEKQKQLIYFYMPQNHTIMHVQLAVLIQSKSILTQTQDAHKVVKKIESEYKEFTANKKEKPQEDCNNKIETRLGFVELLKDKLLLKTKNLNVITIALKNIDEENLKGLLQEVNTTLDKKMQLAQYSGNFYLALYENETFEDVCEKAKNLNAQLNQYTTLHDIIVLSEVYVINLNSMKFEFILEMLQSIEQNKIPQHLKENSQVQFIENMQENKSDEYILQQMLNTIKFNHAELKLLNIYKGLVVNSKATLVKMDEKFVQLQLQNLQTEVVSLQRKSIIEISGFHQTLEMLLKHINLQTGIATFEKATLIKGSVNARKHGRVTCERNTNIAISAAGTTVKGDIVDISLVSLAVKLPYSKVLDKLQGMDVSLSFELTLMKNNLSHTIIRTAKVQRVFVNDEKKVAKVVCDFYDNSDNEHILMEYIFQRQKNIIKEIKKSVLKA